MIVKLTDITVLKLLQSKIQSGKIVGLHCNTLKLIQLFTAHNFSIINELNMSV